MIIWWVFLWHIYSTENSIKTINWMFNIINFIDISNKLGHGQQKTGKVMKCSRKPAWITPHVIRSPGNTNNSSKERWGHLMLRWRGYHTGDVSWLGMKGAASRRLSRSQTDVHPTLWNTWLYRGLRYMDSGVNTFCLQMICIMFLLMFYTTAQFVESGVYLILG